MSTESLGRTGAEPADRTRPTGWVVTASVFMVGAGAVNIVNGLTLIQNGTFYSHHVVYDHLTFWGVVFIAWGALQIVAGAMSFTGRITGYMIGVSLAGVAMVLWFIMIFSAGWAAVVGTAINAAVVYAYTAGAFPDDWR
jgi:hypothetical protein